MLNERPTSAKVLVVDDDPFVQGIITRWLTSEGHQCRQAFNADMAWEILQQESFQLATLDVTMPGRSGFDLLHQITPQYPDMAVLMVTGGNEAATAIKALDSGAWGYLCKPISRAELLFQVRSTLERRHLLIERRQYMENLERRVREQTQEIRSAYEEIVHRLVTASMYRDGETGAHIFRTGLFSAALAEAAGWSPSKIEDIRLAAPMHDLGKISIPDAILCKPGPLTPQERKVMEQHTVIGAKMLTGSQAPMLHMAREIALFHHERWDGKGYNSGLKGDKTPECARIVSIVDVFDALTQDRVYRAAMPEETALEIMEQGSGRHFDPRLLELFFSILPTVRQIARENPDEAMPHRPFDFEQPLEEMDTVLV